MADVTARMRVWILAFGLAALGWAAPPSAQADGLDAAVAAMGDGVVILMRHTQTTPGVGDPPGFDLADRSTQRNLNALGEDQARRFGAALKAAGVVVGGVLVSEWARAEDTARLALEAAGQGEAPIQTLSALNNVWDGDPTGGAFVAEARAAIEAWRGPGVLLMVSHGVTIRPIVGRSAPQGGFFVLKPNPGGGFEVLADAAL